jgi:hypothetical protein
MLLLVLLTIFGHGSLLAAHAVLGALVLLSGVGAIFMRAARRVTLYLLGAQVVFGFIVAGVLKLQPPAAHVILALLLGGLYAAANAMERRGRFPALIRGLLLLGVVLIAVTYYVGEHALGP